MPQRQWGIPLIHLPTSRLSSPPLGAVCCWMIMSFISACVVFCRPDYFWTSRFSSNYGTAESRTLRPLLVSDIYFICILFELTNIHTCALCQGLIFRQQSAQLPRSHTAPRPRHCFHLPLLLIPPRLLFNLCQG